MTAIALVFVINHHEIKSCIYFETTCILVDMKRNETKLNQTIAQSAGAVEYTDCTSAKGQDTLRQRVSWIWH